MASTFRYFFIAVIVGTILAVPILLEFEGPASAPRSVVVARGPAAVPAQKIPKVYGPEERKKIGAANLAALAASFRRFKNVEDMRRSLLAAMNARDRRDMAPLLKDAPLPEVHRVGNEFVFRNGDASLAFSWDEFPKPILRVNGVDWIYKPHQPMKFQLELLFKRLDLKSKGRNAKSELLLPKANANPLTWGSVISAGGGAAFTVLASYGTSQWCSYWVGQGHTQFGHTWCDAQINDRARVLEVTRQKQSVRVLREAPLQNVLDESNLWDPEWTKLCPSEPGQNFYEAEFEKVQVTGDSAAPSPRFKIRLEFLPTGIAKSGFTAPAGTDMTAPDAMSKAINAFKFHEDGWLKEITIRNPNYNPNDPNPDPSIKPTLNIDLSMADSALTPEIKSQRDSIRSLMTTVKTFVNACVESQRLKSIRERRGVPLTKPAQPPPGEVPTVPEGALMPVTPTQAAPAGPAAQ